MGRFAIDFWGVQVAVEWHDPALDRARDLLLPIWRDDPTLCPEAVFRFVNEGLAIEGPDRDFYPFLKNDIVETMERRLHLYLANETREVVFVHAGVVGWEGKAILCPGRSYAGKSTLVWALLKAGASYFSDEYAIIDPQGRIHPFPRPMSLREPEGIRRVQAAELGWSGDALPLRAGAVVTTHYQMGATWQAEPTSPGSAVLDLMSNTVSAQGAPRLAMACLSQAVSGALCYSGVRGEAEGTARQILERLSARF